MDYQKIVLIDYQGTAERISDLSQLLGALNEALGGNVCFAIATGASAEFSKNIVDRYKSDSLLAAVISFQQDSPYDEANFISMREGFSRLHFADLYKRVGGILIDDRPTSGALKIKTLEQLAQRSTVAATCFNRVVYFDNSKANDVAYLTSHIPAVVKAFFEAMANPDGDTQLPDQPII